MSTNMPQSQPEEPEMTDAEVRQTLLGAGLTETQVDQLIAKAQEMEAAADVPPAMQTLALDMMMRKMLADNEASS